MNHLKVALFGAAATAALFTLQSGVASAQGAPAATAPAATAVGEVIVTANKRQENIQNVGMSIQAATGDKLTKLGITDTASLQKIVPGFLFTPTYYGTVVFTIRGVGFQDTSLAGSPTVSVYLDEAPLPFSALAQGATLDLQRVEVLKGPQGTLFGNNATGGAINYIANKPTDTFQAGGDLSYGRFSDTNVQGYVSGPIVEGLDGRLALQSHTSGSWQKGYGPQTGQSTGGQDFLNGRVSLLWKPNDRFKAALTVSGWQDKSYNQVGQLFGIAKLSPSAALDPAIQNFPLAPHNDQAADFQSCVNVDPFDPVTNQNLGTQFAVGPGANGQVGTLDRSGHLITGNPTGYAAGTSGTESEGPGSAVWGGATPIHCIPMRRNNTYYNGTLRMDYDLGNDLVLTSLTTYQKFNRMAAIDGSGIPYQDYQNVQYGKITSVSQEVRLSGKFWGRGSWIVGGNYEHDNTWDRFLQTYNASTASPTVIPFAEFCGPYDAAVTTNSCTSAESSLIKTGATTTAANPAYDAVKYPAILLDTLGPTEPRDAQQTTTYAFFGHGEYPILPNLTLVGGVRFTQENKNGQVCGGDGGDGSWSTVASQITDLLEVLSPTGYLNATYGGASQTHPVGGFVSSTDAYLNGGGLGGANNAGPHGCGTTGPGPNFLSFKGLPIGPNGTLNQNNVAWQAGLNWKVTPQNLLYVNISQGYKGGSFPTVALSAAAQLVPVVQEGLLSYEGGFKSTLFDHQLSVSGAAFYYDYINKQILGAVNDPIFGALPALVNVPHSHVIGFELTGAWTPEFMHGLTITPAVSYQASRVDACSASQNVNCGGGHFHSFDAFSHYADVNGESFPSAPTWQASVDAEYDWKIHDDMTAFVGINVNYTSATHTFFTNPTPGFDNTTGLHSDESQYNALAVPAYTLVDLRAGIEHGAWRAQVWGRNVTNAWYWTAADHVNDVLLRYTGMPVTYGLTISYRYH
jgi:iron complex outermembrane receptor protein